MIYEISNAELIQKLVKGRGYNSLTTQDYNDNNNISQCNNCEYQGNCQHIDDVQRLEQLWETLNLISLVKLECRKFQELYED